MKKQKRRNNILMLISFVCIALGSILIVYKITLPIVKEKQEKEALEKFYENEIKYDTQVDKNDKIDKTSSSEEKKSKSKLEYVAVLKIPKIKLEKGIAGNGSKYNSVDYGIEVLDSSDTPDTDKGNVILCAHAGNSKVSYFRELDLLKVGDVIMIIYKGKTYQYEIVDIYSIKKTGTAPIRKDRTKSTITLITCIHNTDRQIVLIGNLQNSE